MGLVCPFEKFLWSDMQELDEARKLAGRRIDVVVEVLLSLALLGWKLYGDSYEWDDGGKVWIRDGRLHGLG